MIRRLLELRGAWQRWWSARPRRTFDKVLDAAIDPCVTTQICLRAYELEAMIDDSAVCRTAATAVLSEREEKRV